MTAEDLLDAYRDEMAPTLGLAFIEGFIARNRSSMLRMLAPLVALMNERMQAPRVSTPRREEDPDEVTPEKDAIVWAAFRSLVNEKRRAFGMQDLDEVTESMPFFGRRKPDRKEIVEFIQEIKETRKSDWRLAEVLAMHFEFPEKKIVEWLNEFNICPGATVRTMASKCDPSRYKAPKKAEGWLSRKLSGRPKREDLLKVIRELKRERRGDWMLAPTLAGSFGVPDATIVEWLKYHDICPGATTRSMASQCVLEDVESMPFGGRSVGRIRDRGWGSEVAADKLTTRKRELANRRSRVRTPIAVTLRHPRRADLTAMITASASEPGRFQLTWVDNEGPSGHTTRDTPEEAVRYAIEEGYRLDTANSAEARAMVERVQQERERRAAEIESWLTESLPSPKHAGRMGDGIKVGEYVIRIGDMIKMEGQLGGYVENVDRSKGIARIEQDNGEIKTWPLASLLHDTKANRQRQQDHNDKINTEAEARLELSLADWRAR